MKKFNLVIVIAILGSFSSNAQIQKVDQVVYGMDCAPCAYGLERNLKKMDGLQNVRVSLNDGKAYLKLADNNKLTLEQIQEEVKKNGFSAKNAEVIIKGKLINKKDGFEVQTGTETYIIDNGSSDALISKLKPGMVKIKGIVQNEEDGNLSSTWKIKLTEIL